MLFTQNVFSTFQQQLIVRAVELPIRASGTMFAPKHFIIDNVQYAQAAVSALLRITNYVYNPI